MRRTKPFAVSTERVKADWCRLHGVRRPRDARDGRCIGVARKLVAMRIVGSIRHSTVDRPLKKTS